MPYGGLRMTLQQKADAIATLRERFVATLGKQEDRLTTITEEEEKLRADRDAARDKLNDLLAKLEYDADVPE